MVRVKRAIASDLRHLSIHHVENCPKIQDHKRRARLLVSYLSNQHIPSKDPLPDTSFLSQDVVFLREEVTSSCRKHVGPSVCWLSNNRLVTGGHFNAIHMCDKNLKIVNSKQIKGQCNSVKPLNKTRLIALVYKDLKCSLRIYSTNLKLIKLLAEFDNKFKNYSHICVSELYICCLTKTRRTGDGSISKNLLIYTIDESVADESVDAVTEAKKKSGCLSRPQIINLDELKRPSGLCMCTDKQSLLVTDCSGGSISKYNIDDEELVWRVDGLHSPAAVAEAGDDRYLVASRDFPLIYLLEGEGGMISHLKSE